MQQVDFVDETFDINQSSNYIISFQISEEGLAYTIYDIVRNKYVVLTTHPIEGALTHDIYFEELENILVKDQKLDASYKSVNLLKVNRKTTLLPAPFFETDKLKSILEFNTDLDDLDEIHYNYINEIDAYNIFAISNPLVNEFLAKYSNIDVYHQATPFITGSYNYHIHHQTQTNTIFVNMYSDIFDIAVMQKGNLTLYNNFPYQNEDDLVYYILYVYKQLELEPTKDPMLVSGDIKKNSNHIKHLKRFISEIDFLQPDNQYLYSYTFKKLDAHLFTNFFNLLNCV